MYILCSLGTFYPVLVSCANKNLATLFVHAFSETSRLEISLVSAAINYASAPNPENNEIFDVTKVTTDKFFLHKDQNLSLL
jgi:hypothetical protein